MIAGDYRRNFGTAIVENEEKPNRRKRTEHEKSKKYLIFVTAFHFVIMSGSLDQILFSQKRRELSLCR